MSSKYPENDLDKILNVFHVSLSWDYPDDWCLEDVTDTVFYILDQKDTLRSESEFVNNCVQSSGAGVILTQPNINASATPCELHFTANGNNHQFCITRIVIISEAKHVELYLDDLYEKTSKGCLVTMKKGKKAALHENEFDLSSHVQGNHKISLRFLSLADKRSMRLQTVVVKLTACSDIKVEKLNQLGAPMDLSNVKAIIQNMGMPISTDARKLFSEIEQKQRLSLQLANLSHLSTLVNSPLAQISNQQQSNQVQAAENLLTSLLQLQTLNPQEASTVSPLASANQALFPPSKFPVGREHLEPLNHRVRHCKSLSSVDMFDGYGTPNPPNESVLLNALRNREQTKRVAESRAKQISEQNLEQSQMEFVKQFLKSQESGGLARNEQLSSIASFKRDSSKIRPHSLSALPSSSEMDFTNLLGSLMEEEKRIVGQNRSKSDSNTRWETYLRSRIRASQRLSSSDNIDKTSDNTHSLNDFHSEAVVGCKECGSISGDVYHNILQRMDASEKRIIQTIDGKLENLRRHIDSRLDNFFASIYHGNSVIDEDFPGAQDTAV